MSDFLPKYIETDTPAIDEVSRSITGSCCTLLPALRPITNIQAYDRLCATFASHRTKALEYRNYNLKQLAFLLTDNEAKIQASLKADLDKSGFDVLVGDVSHEM
jgi:hypothetical protein